MTHPYVVSLGLLNPQPPHAPLSVVKHAPRLSKLLVGTHGCDPFAYGQQGLGCRFHSFTLHVCMYTAHRREVWG